MILEKTFPLSARGVRKDAPTPPVTPEATALAKCQKKKIPPPRWRRRVALSRSARAAASARSTVLTRCVAPPRFELALLVPIMSHLLVRLRPSSAARGARGALNRALTERIKNTSARTAAAL